MHSSHYRTFTIHHNGDYSGPYIISDIRRDKSGEHISKEYNSIRIESASLFKVFKTHVHLHGIVKDDMIEISGFDDDGTADKKMEITIGFQDLLDFYVQKDKIDRISKIENMPTKKYMSKHILSIIKRDK